VTAAHLHAPLLIADDAEMAGRAVRAQGLRLSAARRLVIEALYAAPAPVAAEEIADGLGGRLPRSDLASVYRNLETLEHVGIVRHVHLGHGPGRYTPTGWPNDFLVCERCQHVATVSADQLRAAREAIRAATGFEARFHHFPISGLCSDCSDEGRP
jgi:Fur family transcriptional regulator, ferric uptake regulator